MEPIRQPKKSNLPAKPKGQRKNRAEQPSKVSYANPEDPVLRRYLIGAIEYLSGQPRLQRLYDNHHRFGDPAESFWDAAVRCLRLTLDGDLRALAAVPRSEPLLVIANHPFGVVDGLVISHLIGRVRPDFKLLAHEAINRAPEVRGHLLPIAFDETRRARLNNVESCRLALRHLRDGGALIIFPAGEVSTAARIFDCATDAPWKPFTSKLITSAEATVLPVFFEGQNSWLFHASSKVCPVLREALLMNEVTRRIGAEIRLHIGQPLPFDSLSRLGEGQALLDYLRRLTYDLPARSESDAGDDSCGSIEDIMTGLGLAEPVGPEAAVRP